jgi:chemotaxis protein methyltransferase CheR
MSNQENNLSPALLKMDDESFERLSVYVTKEYGIKLPENKKSMLESRLNKKVKSLGMNSYSEFISHIFSEQGQQGDLFDVIDLITTNKTDFFRENAHFQFLTNKFLPAVAPQNLKIWSAGCSTGEEPYTIIMSLEEYRKKNPGMTYQLLASDISLRVIQSAHNGVYAIDRLAAIPIEMKRNYFLRGKTNPNLVRVKPQHRNKIEFRRINLMNDQYGLQKGDYDIIFCRNVLIYFDKQKQESVIRKFCSYLKPGGLLFLGHSESIIGMNLPLKQIEPTTYQLV